jgi:hypothetical protein
MIILADSTTYITQTTTKRLKTRWTGGETEKVFLPNMPTSISANNMTEEQQKIYLCKLIFDRNLFQSNFSLSPITNWRINTLLKNE